MWQLGGWLAIGRLAASARQIPHSHPLRGATTFRKKLHFKRGCILVHSKCTINDSFPAINFEFPFKLLDVFSQTFKRVSFFAAKGKLTCKKNPGSNGQKLANWLKWALLWAFFSRFEKNCQIAPPPPVLNC